MDDTHSSGNHPRAPGARPPSLTIGRTVTLVLYPSGSVVPLGPAWSVLCGSVAAGRERWNGSVLPSLVVTLFVVEVLWSSWRAHLIDTDWSACLGRHALPAHGDIMPALPYTAPWSPLGRILGYWGRLRRRTREAAEASGALYALVVLPPVALLLSALVGWRTLILSLAALALAIVEWRLSRNGRRYRVFQAGVELSVAWIAGHIALAPLTSVSFALACCYGLAYQGALGLQASHSDTTGVPWSQRLCYGGQAAAAVVLLMHGSKGAVVAAACTGLLLAPQWLLLYRAMPDKSPADYLRRAVPFMMVGMPIAAWMA